MNWVTDATGLTLSAFTFAALMTFVAAAIRGLTGFGMAIVLVPLLSLIIRPDHAVVLAILLQFVIGPVGMKMILANAHRQSALLIGGVAMLFTPAGLWLLSHTAPELARMIIAGIAIGAFVLVVWPRKRGSIPRLPATIATGVVAGVLTGFAAMPGPPVVPYYLRSGLSPQQARASMMLVFFGTAIAGTFVALLMGLASARLFWLTLLLLPPMLIGNRLGQMAFGKISPPLWHGAVALLLGAAGISAVVRAL